MARTRFCALLFLLAPIASAQNNSGILSGVVQDMTGAPFPDIEVTLSGSGNNFLRKTKTNSSGAFSFLDLGDGAYSIEIATRGFKRYSESGIRLEPGENRMLEPIRLQLGEVTETVSVASNSLHVKLSSSDRSFTMDQQELSDLALQGQDLMDAVSMLPGVTATNDASSSASSRSMNDIFIVGSRSNQKNMTIDGVTNLDTGTNRTVATMPTLGSVAEVQVLTANYGAEYGRNSGGGISIVTRGGGTQFHGMGAWAHRNEEFNANEFFNNATGLPRTPSRFNEFDLNLSGPIFIPRHFNQDRSKLFFFLSGQYQGQLVAFGQRRVRVPTALERQGNFSQTDDVNGKLWPVVDPLNARKAFPGNVIPASRFDSSGAAILNLFPLPNFVDPNPANRYQWNYISNATGAEPRQTEVGRVDYAASSAVQFYARYSRYTDTQDNPYASGSNFPLTTTVVKQPGWSGTFHAATAISSTFFGEFIFGVSQRKQENNLLDPAQVSRAATGVDVGEWTPGATLADALPQFSFGGISNVANPSISPTLPRYISNTVFTIAENMTKVAAAHTLKFGVYYERARDDRSADVPVRGLIGFDQDGNNPGDANYPFATALLGNYDYYQEANNRPQGHYRFTNLEWYGSDNWRIRRNLTLDFGLRLYHDSPQYDARGQLTSFVPGAYTYADAPLLLPPGLVNGKRAAVNPLTGDGYSLGLIGTFAPGVGNPVDGMVRGGADGTPSSLYSVPALSAAPRLGFAWDPFGTGRTAIRGGAGVFYDRIAGQPTIDTFKNPPNVFTPQAYYGTLESLAASGGSAVLGPGNVVTLFGAAKLPVTYNYSLGVQRQLGRGMLLDLAYVGSQSRHLLWERNINPVPIGADYPALFPQFHDPTNKNVQLPPNFLRPYLGYGDIYSYEFGSSSNYNSAQASLNRRFSRGLRGGFSYTFSKILGTADQDAARVSPFFKPRSWNYGPLSYDRSQTATLFYTYDLPNPGRALAWRPLEVVAGNWALSGVTRMSTGGPFTPGLTTTDGQDITGTPSEYARLVDLYPNNPPALRFGRPKQFTFGNVGVGSLRLPGFDNWDMSIYRRLQLTERLSGQLRFETYNTFNHTQFSSLSTVATFNPAGQQVDPLFLTPTAARSSRKIQLGIRVNW